ncbi:MAG: ABC transporter substrate-binding protein [Desulfomonile tiedjei]|uniref:ABC transporter substrate-binding protein n=1 Tax=Desulfomonile tiedjei TaxID=2358 RepID=A0A9D6V5P2_9BACT|nr:ABC transporter substrate-binding protein [Desulfomonile tiedjei]
MKRAALLVVGALAISLICLGISMAADPIKVGVVLPLTGEQAKFGEIEKNSFLMCLEEINKAGGIKGRPIELLIEDDTGKPDVGRSAVEKLISQDKVVVLSGGYSSSVTYAMCAVAQQRKIPFLVTTGSADKITEQGWDYVFRLNPPVSEYPQALESFMKEVAKTQSVAILHENTLFGQSGSKEFAALCETAGVKVLMKEGYEAGAVDFKPLLVKVKAAKPDMVYMISYIMDAALLMRQSKELEFNPKLFVGGGAGFTLPEFAKNAGDAADDVFSADLWSPKVPYPGAQEYFDNYGKKFGSPTEYHGAEAYASMQVLADVLKRAKDLTPAGVREAMLVTDMKTVFGPVKFIAYGKKKQQNQLPTYLVQWQKGTLETVWPKSVATKPYVYPILPWAEKKK